MNSVKKLRPKIQNFFQRSEIQERLLIGLVTIFLLVLGFASVRYYYLSTDVALSSNPQEVRISKGMNLQDIAELLDRQELIRDQRSFIIATKLMGRDKSLKAGRFLLQDVRNYYDLIVNLSNSQVHTVQVTIPEGYQARQIAQLLYQSLNIDPAEFMRYLDHKPIMKKHAVESPTLEGYLFPDTYEFSDGITPLEIIEKMVDHFFQMIDDSLRNLIEQSGRSLHAVLTMASIVEGECMIDAERPIVASIYMNRLKKRMRLESDPTIQYIIPDGPRRLLKADLEIDSPYNTYRHWGLPPGPINNPGLKSILAAIRPEQTNYLYMVAVGDGSHTFTHDYYQFLRAKRNFQRVRRRVRQEEKQGN